MAAKDASRLITKIEDDASWQAALASSDKALAVIDIYSDWCGPCEAVLPTLSRVYLDYEAAEERLKLYAASANKLSAQIQSSLPTDLHISLDKHGCLPLFALYRVSRLTMIG